MILCQKIPILLSLFSFILAPPLKAEDSRRHSVDQIFLRIETLESQQVGQDTKKIRELNKKIETLGSEIQKMGDAAVPGLSSIAKDAKRSEKTRFWAVTFLAMTRDPSALAPLTEVLVDTTAPALERGQAAFGIPGIDISPAAKREALCRALPLELPAEPLRETLSTLARLGCDEVGPLERRARQFGVRPNPRESRLALNAIQALGKSHPVEAARALWRVFDFFPRRSAERLEVLRQLQSQHDNLRAMGPISLRYAEEALSSESASPENTVEAVKLLDSFRNPKAAPTFIRFLKNNDPEAVALCAEALVHLRDKETAKIVREIIAHVDKDPRFAPAPGRPDPREMLVRLQNAAEDLERLP